MDKFPEAFRRFEQVVDVSKIGTYRQLESTFGSWAGHKWGPTRRQSQALSIQAKRLDIPKVIQPPSLFSRPKTVNWRTERIEIRGRTRTVFRDTETGRFIKHPR